MIKERARSAVEAERDRLLEVAGEIWDRPELGLEEEESSRLLAEWAADEGFEVRRGIGPLDTAFVASYGDGDPRIGILGEYDALPDLSQRVATERDPVEPEAPGHGCGHNLFGVAGLGAAVAVARALEADGIDGTIRFYGCPAEEDGIGKVFMHREGVFDDLDAALTWHPGQYTAPVRASTLALDSVHFTFEGTSAHAAGSPDSGRSALDAVSLLNTGVEYVREHVPESARVHYAITDGGGAPNTVPATASVHYQIRAPTRPEVERITDWVYDVAAGAATMTRTAVRDRYLTGVYEYLPNPTITDVVFDNARTIGEIEYDDADRAFAADLQSTLGDDVLESKRREFPDEHRERVTDEPLYSTPVDAQNDGDALPISSDVGNVSWVVPTGQFTAATWPVGTPAHTWQAVAASGGFGTKAVPFVAAVLAGAAVDLLTDEELVAAARSAFTEATADRSYADPIPNEVTDPTPSHRLG